MSDAQTQPAGLSQESPDWNQLWADADLPDEDRNAWREAMAHRSRVPDPAERLARHGLRPEVVVAARTNPDVYWPFTGAAEVSVDQLAQLAVLAGETADYHDARASLARDVRARCVRSLAEDAPGGAGWSGERIGALLNLTRQRVRAILKRTSD